MILSTPARGRHYARGPVMENLKIERLEQLVMALLDEVIALRQSVPRKKDAGRDTPYGFNLTEEVRRFEAHIIRDALLQTGGHQSRAARLLGIKPTTLNEKIKRFEIRCHFSSAGQENLSQHPPVE